MPSNLRHSGRAAERIHLICHMHARRSAIGSLFVASGIVLIVVGVAVWIGQRLRAFNLFPSAGELAALVGIAVIWFGRSFAAGTLGRFRTADRLPWLDSGALRTRLCESVDRWSPTPGPKAGAR